MELKTVEFEGKHYAEIQDGKPIYVEDGKDVAFDAVGTRETIKRLNGEAKGHREAKEAAESALKAFEGIKDPKAALDAMKQLENFKDKDLIDAGKVEEIKAAAIKAKDEEYAPVVKERDALKQSLHDEKIGGSFARSKFISEKVAVPSEMVQAQFGRHFSIEEGKIVAKDASGNQIYSKASPGNPANFDEALEIIIDGYAYKDHILKGTGSNGSGSNGSGGKGGGNGTKTLTRAEFDGLTPIEQTTKMREGFKVVDAA